MSPFSHLKIQRLFPEAGLGRLGQDVVRGCDFLYLSHFMHPLQDVVDPSRVTFGDVVVFVDEGFDRCCASAFHKVRTH